MSLPLIRVNDLSVHYKSGPSDRKHGGVTKAVDRVDLRIMRGEVYSLVGESGSGKTTLGRAVSGLLRPTSGSVEIAGQAIDYKRRVELWKTCQMVFQDPYSSFAPLSTVIESLYVPLNKYHVYGTQAEKQHAVEQMLEEVGLSYPELEGKYPGQLSGGQRQRASITRAMLVGPDILVADEPISMLDVSSRIGILNLLRDLNRKRGLTVLFITHDLGAAEYLGGRVAVMYRGQVLEVAEPEDLLANPANPYTEVLLRAAPKIAQREWLAKHDTVRRITNGSSTGCSFYHRCPRSGAPCASDKPALQELGSGAEHLVACHFPLGRQAS